MTNDKIKLDEKKAEIYNYLKMLPQTEIVSFSQEINYWEIDMIDINIHGKLTCTFVDFWGKKGIGSEPIENINNYNTLKLILDEVKNYVKHWKAYNKIK